MNSRVALVTGASRGIGRGIAVELARIGYSVAINFKSRETAALESRAFCQKISPGTSKARFETFQADIANADHRTRLVKSVAERFGWIDLLVNNAGAAPDVRTDILEADEESFDRLMAINAKGPYFLTQSVANFWISRLQESSGSRPRPKIVSISSVSANAPSVNRGDYCMSKAALSMMTLLYAARLAEYGINVYELRPGLVETDMTAAARDKYEQMIAEGLTPIPRWGTPEDVGRAVAAIAEDKFPFSTGAVFDLDGGFHIRRL